MIKVHLDTDIGGDIDDLCALAMLLKWSGVEIIGITTVADEGGKRAGYAKYALRVSGRENVPVAAGADVSLGCYRFKPGYPIEEKYWPEPVSPLPGSLDDALGILRNSIEQGAIIIGIGPFTNFFLLDKKYPGLLSQANLYLMGGYIYPPRQGFPQWKNDMDYNVQLDVQSAKHVIEMCNPTLVPLNITVETSLRRAYLRNLSQSVNPLAKIIAVQAEECARDWNNEEKYGKTCVGLPDDTINFQHDSLACAVALGWEGAEIDSVDLRLELKNSWLTETIDEFGKLTKIVTSIDGKSFNDFWADLLVRDL
ncbi:MAG: nucleoside hydrolase [Patescibacteria group bacterium]